MFRIKPNDHHCGITRSGNYIPATVGFLDPPERLFNLKGEMTYDVPECIWRKLFDDWMDDFGFRDNFFSGKNPLYGKHAKNIMKTDVRETDKGYELDVDLPGFKKDEVQVQLKDGYLTISAAKGLDKDEEDKKGNYIRRERYAGSTSRSFYVGNGVKNEDVHAKFENGVLRLSIPKKAAEEIEADKYVSIEG